MVFCIFETNSGCDAKTELLPQALDRGSGTSPAGPVLAKAHLEQPDNFLYRDTSVKNFSQRQLIDNQ